MRISNINLIHNVLKSNVSGKILLILSFIFILLALIVIAGTPAADGYEISIYGAYPGYFWIFLIGAIFSAILVLLQEIFSNKKTNRWIIAFFAILLGNFIFLLLSLFRGYCFIGGASADIFSHIGWIKEISLSGYTSSDNFYPIIHIFIASISNLLDVSVTTVIQFAPAFFWMLYSPFIFLMSRSVSKNNGQALLITSFSFPLIFSIFQLTIHPSFISFIFLPLLLYLYHKRNCSERKIEMSILIMILCFFIVFFHPMTTLINVIVFTTLIGSAFILRKIKRFLRHDVGNIAPHTATVIILILIISFFTWYTSYGSGHHAIRSIYHNLAYGSEWTIATNYASTLSNAQPTVFQLIRLVVLQYGAIIIYGLTAFVCLAAIGKKLVFSRKIKEIEFLYGMQLVAAFLFAGAMIVSNFIVSNPVRSSRYFLMVATIFNGLVVYFILDKKQNMKNNQKPKLLLSIGKCGLYLNKKQRRMFNKKKILLPLLTVLLFFSIVICIYNVYPSAVTWQPNSQFTHMNFAGSSWVVENRDIYIQISGDYGVNVKRMEHYMNGVEMGNIRLKKDSLGTPTHFGYDVNTTLSQVFDYTDTYMLTTENGRRAVDAFPKNLQPRSRQFTSDDFNKLNSDVTVNNIYDNKELETWFVYSD